MNRLQKSVLNLVFSLISQIVTLILGMLLPRMILVGYGSEVNGLLNSVTQMVAYLVIFEAGIQSAATKSLYQTLGRKDQLGTNQILAAVNRQYHKIGWLYLLGLLLLAVFYPVFITVDGFSRWSVFLIVFFSGLGNVVSFFFQAKYQILLSVDGKGYLLTIGNTAANILNHLLKILLLSLDFPVHFVIIFSFFVSLIQMLLISLYVKRAYRWIDLKATPDDAALRQSRHAMAHQISGLIFSNTDVLLLTAFCDLKVVSVYSVYKMIIGHISGILAMPFASCTFALGQEFHIDVERYQEMLDGIQVIFSVLVFAVLTVTDLLFLPFLSLYTAEVTDIGYMDPYLPALFVAAEGLNLIRCPARHTVNCAGHFKETVSRTVMETSINLIVSVIGVRAFGIYGVLFGTIAALGYRSIDFIVYANHAILKRGAKKDLMLYGMNFLCSVAVISVLGLFHYEIQTYWDFLLAGLILTPVVIGLFLLINFVCFRADAMYLLNYVKNRLKCRHQKNSCPTLAGERR